MPNKRMYRTVQQRRCPSLAFLKVGIETRGDWVVVAGGRDI